MLVRIGRLPEFRIDAIRFKRNFTVSFYVDGKEISPTDVENPFPTIGYTVRRDTTPDGEPIIHFVYKSPQPTQIN
jgi:hypothetical protein